MTDVSVSAGAAFPLLLICLELFGFLTAFLLAEETRTREALEAELRRTQDDSTERDLLLTEKKPIHTGKTGLRNLHSHPS